MTAAVTIARNGDDFDKLRCPKCGAMVRRTDTIFEEGHSEDDEAEVPCSCGALLRVWCSQLVFSYKVEAYDLGDEDEVT